MFMRRRRRDEAWQGVVVGKKRTTTDGSGIYFYLTVRLADGTTKRTRVRRSTWKSVQEGDSVVKKAGAQPVKQ